MPTAAPAGAEERASQTQDLAALSAAMIGLHAWAKTHPGVLSSERPAGYQRTIRWKALKRENGTFEHLIVLRREHLAPYDLDHENVAAALIGARDGQGGELVVLERRWMDENDYAAGVCYKVGPPPPPAEQDQQEEAA